MKPLDNESSTPQNVPSSAAATGEDDEAGGTLSNEDDEENDDDKEEDQGDIQAALHDGLTFEEVMNEKIATIGDSLEGLKYQVQFQDHCMLQVLE